jgi:hypothetical protein
MTFRTISISTVAALLIAASQAGAQEANHHQHGAPSGQSANMMGMMRNDPAAMCGSMMQSMMSDPVIHKRMNELMRRNMQGTGSKYPMMPMPSPGATHP